MDKHPEYRPPAIEEIGTLHKLTLAGGSYSKDGSVGDVLSGITGQVGSLTITSTTP